MTDNEKEYIRLMFCLHKLISDGLGDSEKADEIRDQMEIVELKEKINRDFEADLSCWCYALHEKDAIMAERYRKFLFDKIIDEEWKQ